MSDSEDAKDSAAVGGDGDHKEMQPPPAKQIKSDVESADSQSSGEEERDDKRIHTLASFGYSYTSAGELRSLTNNEPFKFDFYPERSRNQKRYEVIGELVTDYIYQLLEKEAGLVRITVPKDASEDEPTSFIFVSEDAMTNKDKLMILIHGSGVVRAGQWARRLAINDNLDTGTQLPFIKRAKDEGYAIVVMNTNNNVVKHPKTNKKSNIRGSETPEKHAVYVWDNVISVAQAKHIAIVAHSYGGVVTFKLTSKRQDEVMRRVFAIAFTDSVHGYSSASLTPEADAWMRKIGKNWVSSPNFLDTPENIKGRTDVPRVSAGTDMHEMTSSKSMESIFKFFSGKYVELVTPPSDEL